MPPQPKPAPAAAALGLGEDLTVKPFLHGKRQRMGERGGDDIRARKKPRTEHIRETAVDYPQFRTGQGLHELIPTNLGASLATIPNATQRHQMAQAQEGLRTTPAMTPLRSPPGAPGPSQVGGHTGTYINPATGGSSHTSVQNSAHNHLRQASAAAIKDSAQDARLLARMITAQLDVTPHGRQLMDDHSLTGAIPNRNTLGALEAPAKKAGPNRVAHAQEMHQAREEVKARGRALVRSVHDRTKADRSPSPERRAIKSDGSGGEYIVATTKKSRVAVLPKVKNPALRTYLHGEWATKPMRAKL